MSRATITLSNDNWEFILDSLGDRLENLSDLNTGDYGLEGEFDHDIRHAESLIKVIRKYNV